MLAIFLREPFTGITPEVYAEASDWQILHVFLAPRDDDHNHVPMKRRAEVSAIKARARAFRDAPLPSAEALRIPQEALALMPEGMAAGNPGFIAMYWQRLSNVGLPPEEILERWKQYAAKDFN